MFLSVTTYAGFLTFFHVYFYHVYLFHGFVPCHSQNNSFCNTNGRRFVYACQVFTVKYLGSKNASFSNSIYMYLTFLYVYCFHPCLLNTRTGTLSTLFSRSGYFVLLYHNQKIDVFYVYFYICLLFFTD